MTRIDGHDFEEIGSFLRKGAWFGGLPAALQERILRRSVLRSYKKGRVICEEGLVPQGLQALLEGRIEIFRHAGTEGQILVHVAEPGFWFGEVAVLAGRAAVVSVLAETDVRTVLLPTAEFEKAVEEEPGFYRPLAGLVIERYATVLGFLAQVGGLSAEASLRQRLADLVALRRLEGDVEGDVVLTVSQAALGRLLGVSRQTLNGLLRQLESEGLIQVGFRSIRVRERDRLRGAGRRLCTNSTRRTPDD
jgi:CRP/FNR family cyclic AMP-dependent transcriptional regulator